MRRRRRHTREFTFLAWASFVLAMLAQYIGLWYLEEPLSVKGYYAVTAAFLVMSAFVLQKVIRDNAEDDELEAERFVAPKVPDNQ